MDDWEDWDYFFMLAGLFTTRTLYLELLSMMIVRLWNGREDFESLNHSSIDS
jgi:hypothetical protein